MTRSQLPLVLAAACVMALMMVASPLLVVAAIVTPFCIAWCGRGLPADERRVLFTLLLVAIAARVAVVAAQLLRGVPELNDMSVGALAGDESYYLSRALRARDLMLGYAATKYDFFVTNDEYGYTSYLTVLTWLQMVFGPTPYSLKVVNGIVFVLGAALLFRMARAAFGTLPAFMALTMLLFVPSLLFSSVSLLKESAYFLVSSAFLVIVWRAITRARGGEWRAVPPLLVAAVLWLLVLDGLRRGALLLMIGGAIAGFALYVATRTRARIIVTAGAAVIAVAMVLFVPSLHARAIDGVETLAKSHAGHVFTVGHVYKLLDEGYYVTPQMALRWDLQLSDAEAFRFLVRGAVSFFVTPWPWEMRSTGELALLPEHLLWYLMIVLLPFGIAAGWKADPFATALFIGFAIPTAVVVAYTNGNVGTLFRLRGLVTPYIIWIAAIGLCVAGEKLATMRVRRARLVEEPAQ